MQLYTELKPLNQYIVYESSPEVLYPYVILQYENESFNIRRKGHELFVDTMVHGIAVYILLKKIVAEIGSTVRVCT